MRVLVVEDEVKMAAIRRGLREGMAVDVTERGEDALWMAGSTEYDAIVLDVMLPGIDGFETCKRLRGDGVWAPVLMLTARDAVEDRVSGLDGGADDYLTKPFSFAELLARLRALARRPPAERPDAARGRRAAPRPGDAPGVAGATPRSRCPRRSSPCSRCSCGARARCCPATSFSNTRGTTRTRTAQRGRRVRALPAREDRPAVRRRASRPCAAPGTG